MAKKVFYCYNPETDNFERYYPSMRDRLMTLSRYLVAGAAIGALFAVGFFYLTGGPTENALRHENSELRSKYNVLSRRLDNSLKVMDNIKKRDDNFYRVLMQMEPLARSRRYAGLDNLINPDLA